MKTFQNFFIEGCDFDTQTLTASFRYSFDHEVKFTETIDFSSPGFTPITNIDPRVMQHLLFHLSLAIGISYYKLCPTAEITVENGYLTSDQHAFRNTFYLHGLGEYFFRNKISPRGLAQFVNGKQENNFDFLHAHFAIESKKIMVAIGGGKDSCVSAELVKKSLLGGGQGGLPFYTSTFGKDYFLHQIVNEKIGAQRLVMKRTMDPQLFAMNEEGYYNGHVPISGIIAFVLVTAAYLYDYTYIVMSNEKSANEGNTTMDGIDVNHQRSKSLAFEEAFSQYIKNTLTPDIKYFSLLRGMYEIKIAQLFAQYPHYFDVFSSCNTNFKILSPPPENASTLQRFNVSTSKRRCGSCPKCAFVYAILRPFVDKIQTQTIWGKELFEDETLLQTFKELLGIEGIKPFECVGTNEEMVLAMKKSYDLWTDTYHESLPVGLQMFANLVLPTMDEKDFAVLEQKLMHIAPEDMIPAELRFLLPL